MFLCDADGPVPDGPIMPVLQLFLAVSADKKGDHPQPGDGGRHSTSHPDAVAYKIIQHRHFVIQHPGRIIRFRYPVNF